MIPAADLYLSLDDLVEPLLERLSSVERMEHLFHRYGWRIALDDAVFGVINDALKVRTALERFRLAAAPLRQQLIEQPDARLNPQDLLSLAEPGAALIAALGALELSQLAGLPDPLSGREFWDSVADHLFDDLLEEYLRIHHPILYAVLHAAGVVRYDAASPTGAFRGPYTRVVFDWRQVAALVEHPLTALKRAYRWGDPAESFDHQRLVGALENVLPALRVPVERVAPSLQQTRLLPADAAYRIQSDVDALRATLGYGFTVRDRTVFEIGFELFPVGTIERPVPSGFLLNPVIRGGLDGTLPLGDDLLLRWQAAGSAGEALGVAVLPDRTDLTGGAVTVGAALEVVGTRDAPWYVIGNSRTARIELQGLSLRASIERDAGGPEARLRLSANTVNGQPGAKVVVPLDDADGFLKQVVDRSALELSFSPDIIWSSRTGLTFNGKPTIDIALPIDVAVGTARFRDLRIRLNTTGSGDTPIIELAASAAIDVSLGPVRASVDGVGLAMRFDFARTPRNFGVADVSLTFKPPTGIGLAIDAQLVLGGGFLNFDPEKEEYSGILQLEIAETIAVKGVGLLTTRLPDGSKGFSLLVILSAEGFAPIQLGFGFMLTGIGGLLGVNRTVVVDALRGGLKSGSLNAILFPADPIRNAPQIVSDLRSVFPPAKDRYVFGPMALIAWGAPTILTLEIGLILELPEPVRLIVLGRLRALLPDDRHALIQVRMDAIGVIDFHKGEASLDATLYDSRILAFVLTGDMALRANWGRQPNFVLAIGGLNPRYTPPAGFPQLARLALSLGESDNPRLRFEAYLALTSNTVQFGARFEFSYSAAGFTLSGLLGFDALFQFSPFEFIADVGAMVALKRGRSVLMGVFLEMSLSGPAPWHVWGIATFKVLFFKVSIRFDHRFGREEPPALPAPVDVVTLLAGALGDRRNWSTALPQGELSIVSLRDERAAPNMLRVHPLAELTVRQRVVPLNRPVTRFGNAALAEQTIFSVTASSSDGSTLRLPSTPVQDAFAAAQYQEMSDDEKLTRPAFEMQDAGLQFAMDETAYQYDALPDTGIAYETLVIDPTSPADTITLNTSYVPPPAVLDAFVNLGAAGQAAVRRRGSSRYRALERVA